MMLQSILVPLDGSVFAEHALPFAVSIARQTGATLRLLRVVPPLADYFFWAPMPGDPMEGELRQLHRTEAQNYLDGVVGRLKGSGFGTVSSDVVEEQEGVSESIGADVARMGVNLVVMTSHGRGAVSRVWFGSVADKLVRTLPVPVLLVRPCDHPLGNDLGRRVNLKHFILALDGTPLAERILEPALVIGKALGADLYPDLRRPTRLARVFSSRGGWLHRGTFPEMDGRARKLTANNATMPRSTFRRWPSVSVPREQPCKRVFASRNERPPPSSSKRLPAGLT